MREISLSGSWKCTFPDGSSINNEVPGYWELYTDNKSIGDMVVFEKTVDIESINGYSFLCFEGVSYYCNVFVGDDKIGFHEGIWDAFCFDITKYLEVGTNKI